MHPEETADRKREAYRRVIKVAEREEVILQKGKRRERERDRNFSVYIEKSRGCQKRRLGVFRREVFKDLAGY